MNLVDRDATRIRNLLAGNVPEDLQGSFLAQFSAILGSMEDNEVNRIDVFNEVQKRLGDESRQKKT